MTQDTNWEDAEELVIFDDEEENDYLTARQHCSRMLNAAHANNDEMHADKEGDAMDIGSDQEGSYEEFSDDEVVDKGAAEFSQRKTVTTGDADENTIQTVVASDNTTDEPSSDYYESNSDHKPSTGALKKESVDSLPVEEEPSGKRIAERRTITNEAAFDDDIMIDDGKDIELNFINPEGVRDAQRAALRGQTPESMTRGRESVFALVKRNHLKFSLLVAELVVFTLLTIAIINAALNVPAVGVPKYSAATDYNRAVKTKEYMVDYANFLTMKMETYNHWNIEKKTKGLVGYFDPKIRAVYEAERKELKRDADRYKERQAAEPLLAVYRGVAKETIHTIFVFYQNFEGRGKEDGNFKVDNVARRCKVIQVAEGNKVPENTYGLYVVKHFDLSEKEYLKQFPESGNPWDLAQGIKTKNEKKTDK